MEQNTAPDIIEEFIAEKMDKAVEVLNEESEMSNLLTLEEGISYKRETISLGDGCSLIVELEDDSAISKDGIQSRATSRSNTLWKNYGRRYFTASTTVNFSLGTVTMNLRNYYVLSSKGIDEDQGTGTLIYDTIGGNYSVSDPVITDATARTVGASDVNMECQYTLRYNNVDDVSVKKIYKITSTVGFVDINKAKEKVKVEQSWKLTRLT